MVTLLRRLLVLVPAERRDWVEAALSETADAPDRRSWLVGVGWLLIREVVLNRHVARAVSFIGFSGVGIAGVWAVIVVTRGVTYPALRHAMIALVVVLAAVSLLGWLPRALGPTAADPAARAVRAMGLALAGLAVWGVVLEMWYNRDPAEVNPGVAERAHTGIPMATVLFAVYLAAFLAATQRGTALRAAILLRVTAVAVTAVAVWAGAAILMPSASVLVAIVAMVAAGLGAANWTSRAGAAPSGSTMAGLLSTVMTAQIIVTVADIMFHLGPNSWIPDAGPGPLTLADRLAQNRVEAIDPYVAVLLLGALVALTLTVVAQAQRSTRTATALETTGPGRATRWRS
jgi:hypothetical protein